MKWQVKENEIVIYQNHDRTYVGKVKRLCEDGDSAFVYYSEGETAAKTPLELLRPIENAYCIKSTSFGGAS